MAPTDPSEVPPTPTKPEDPSFLAGTHCSLPSCNSLDFLPLRCRHCSLSFCSAHAFPDRHSCTSLASVAGSAATREGEKRWTEEGERFEDLLPDRQTAWQKQRDEASALDASKAARKAAALAVLHRNFPQSTSSSSLTSSSAPKKKPLSPAIKLMQLKRRAKAGDPRKKEGDVPMEARWYGSVKWVDDGDEVKADGENEGLHVWFDKDIVAGKALDLLTTTLRVPPASTPSASPSLLRLFLPSTRQTLDLSKALGGHVGIGEQVWIVRGDWTDDLEGVSANAAA